MLARSLTLIKPLNSILSMSAPTTSAEEHRLTLVTMTSAIVSLTQVLEMDPNEVDAYYARGSIKSRRGDYTDAIFDLDKAIELDAVHPIAYSNRGAVKVKLGESEAAHGNAKEAQRLYEEADRRL